MGMFAQSQESGLLPCPGSVEPSEDGSEGTGPGEASVSETGDGASIWRLLLWSCPGCSERLDLTRCSNTIYLL